MLNVLALATTFGTLLGLCYFFLTLFHIIRGKGPIIHFLGHHLPGYRRNIKGATVSLIWGFIFGSISGILIAIVYNFYLSIITT